MPSNELAKQARSIFQAALKGVQPDFLLERVNLRGLFGRPVTSFRRVVVVGGGKASMVMAGALEERIGDQIDEGLVVVPHGYPATFPQTVQMPKQIEVVEAAHPFPDQAGVEATRRLMQLCSSSSEDDLVVVLLSGGGSSLLPALANGISLKDGERLYQLLVESGADIHEINTVRKHCSAVSGGRLARLAAPATVQTLVISDVVGNDFSVIASGPTVPDPTTFPEAVHVLHKYHLWKQLPAAVRHHLEKGVKDPACETPKEKDPVFEHVNTTLLGSNRDALKAARKAALEQGFRTKVVREDITGEAREVGARLVAELLEEKAAGPLCLLWGGETTVTVNGSGKGGRNQEVALAAAIEMARSKRSMVLLSGGTDGVDGPTDAAGAWASPQTVRQAKAKGLEAQAYLADNNAYAFFNEIDGLVTTGPTHTNVMDLQIALVDLA